MSDLQLYANIFSGIDGKLLLEQQTVSLSKKSGLNPVFTVGSGFAGMSQGASTMEISIENAVPTTDLEFNPDMYLRTGAVVEVSFIMAGRQTVAKGFITEANYSYSVNEHAKVSMTIMARFSDFE